MGQTKPQKFCDVIQPRREVVKGIVGEATRRATWIFHGKPHFDFPQDGRTWASHLLCLIHSTCFCFSVASVGAVILTSLPYQTCEMVPLMLGSYWGESQWRIIWICLFFSPDFMWFNILNCRVINVDGSFNHGISKSKLTELLTICVTWLQFSLICCYLKSLSAQGNNIGNKKVEPKPGLKFVKVGFKSTTRAAAHQYIVANTPTAWKQEKNP